VEKHTSVLGELTQLRREVVATSAGCNEVPICEQQTGPVQGTEPGATAATHGGSCKLTRYQPACCDAAEAAR